MGRGDNASLPPLAQDVYDRLAILELDLEAARPQRALMNIESRPELLPASDLLWRLRYLGVPVQPIVGERTLGCKPIQESWDIDIGRHQHVLLELGDEGEDIEQVLEKRLKEKAWKETARSVTALEAAEDSILYLKNGPLTGEIGLHAVTLLRTELDAKDAPEMLRRVRRLVGYYRPVGLPGWLKDFVSTGYQRYTTLLPTAFTDQSTKPDELAAMLAFIFRQETLAFSMGCPRSQLLIAAKRALPKDPPKRVLWWAAQRAFGLKSEEEILSEALLLAVFPEGMAGFLMALEFTPRLARLAVDLLRRALPDELRAPWLSKLMVALQPPGVALATALLREAGLPLPHNVDALSSWLFPSEQVPRPPPVTLKRSPEEEAIAKLLRDHPGPMDGLAGRLGITGAPGRRTAPP